MRLLGERLLESPFSLTEARLLFELAPRKETDVATLRRDLDLDAGYVSRILSRFRSTGLASTERSRSDGRRQVVRLTDAGRRAFESLDVRSAAEASVLLSRLEEADQRRLIGAMTAIRQVLEPRPEAESYLLRSPGPGDLGWVVARHGALYDREYGWDETFEALVARIVAGYAEERDPRRESAWIAEMDGVRVGCAFCLKKEEDVAQLRLLLVDPGARGKGIGARLIEESVRFARRAGYGHLALWTNDVLVHARSLYEAAGFELVAEEAHHSFGHDLVGQHWSREL